MLMDNIPNDNFNFSAQPRVVQPKSLYRDQVAEPALPSAPKFNNLMWEKRVYRGNTHGTTVVRQPIDEKSYESNLPKKARITHLNQADQNNGDNQEGESKKKLILNGVEYEHREACTDEYVEILTSKAPCYDQEAQTEFKIEKPPIRLVLPKKTGIDKESQIYDGELFNFNKEVEPILQVLCGRTLEESRMEVLEEQELIAMKAAQKNFADLKNQEIANAKKLEMHERKLLEENELRKQQFKQKKNKNIDTHKRVISRVIGKEFSKNFLCESFECLGEKGFFNNVFQMSLDAKFLPFISNHIYASSCIEDAIEQIVSHFSNQCHLNLKEIHKQRVNIHKEKVEEKRRQEEQLRCEIAEAKRIKEEARKKRREERRKNNLKQKIIDLIITKSEAKTDFYSQPLSDVDSLGAEYPTVGFLGGIVLEIALFLTVLTNLANLEDEKLGKLKSIQIGPDFIKNLLTNILAEYFTGNGFIDIGVTQEAIDDIKAVDPDIKIENIYQTDGGNKKEIFSILKNSLSMNGINLISGNLNELGILQDIISMIFERIAHLIVNDENNGKKFRLVAPNDSNLKEANVIVKLKPLIEDDGEDPNQSQHQHEKSVVSETGSGNPEANKIKYVEDYTEVPLESKVTLVPRRAEDLVVLFIHFAPQILFRRDFVFKMVGVLKELKDLDSFIIQSWMDLGKKIENIFLSKFSKIDYFEIDSYQQIKFY